MPARPKTPTPASLILETPGSEPQTHLLQKDVVRIGRLPRPDNDLVLEDSRVSRLHAEVRRSGHRYLVRDVGSRNGTFLNGVDIRELPQPTVLTSGDVLRVGSFCLRFHDPASTIVDRIARGLVVDDARGEVRVADQILSMTPKEYVLIRLLSRRAGMVCERDEIARTVWPEYDGQIEDYMIDNLVARLRQKVERDPRAGVRLVAVKKRGYRLLSGSAR